MIYNVFIYINYNIVYNIIVNSYLLTVLKSDNAYGLFLFNGECVPVSTFEENTVFNCDVVRQKGHASTVTLSWAVEDSDGELAVNDFVEAQGELIFEHGIDENVSFATDVDLEVIIIYVAISRRP